MSIPGRIAAELRENFNERKCDTFETYATVSSDLVVAILLIKSMGYEGNSAIQCVVRSEARQELSCRQEVKVDVSELVVIKFKIQDKKYKSQSWQRT